MTIQAHLEALKSKHKASEAQLAEAITHAAASDQEIAAVKHRKLAIKDEITTLEVKLR